jgi:hypothetical protein
MLMTQREVRAMSAEAERLRERAQQLPERASHTV